MLLVTPIPRALYYLEKKKRTLVQSVWNKIFIREIIIDNEIYFPNEISIGEDHIFFLLYCQHINTLSTIDKILYTHIKNEGSLSNKHHNYKILNLRANLEYQLTKSLLVKRPFEEYDSFILFNRRIDDFFALLALSNDPSVENTDRKSVV